MTLEIILNTLTEEVFNKEQHPLLANNSTFYIIIFYKYNVSLSSKVDMNS